MSNIPVARRLLQQAQELLDQTRVLLDREKPATRAPRRRVTPSTKEILAFINDNKRLDQMAVAEHFGTNPGRVSEAVRKGKVYL